MEVNIRGSTGIKICLLISCVMYNILRTYVVLHWELNVPTRGNKLAASGAVPSQTLSYWVHAYVVHILLCAYIVNCIFEWFIALLTFFIFNVFLPAPSFNLLWFLLIVPVLNCYIDFSFENILVYRKLKKKMVFCFLGL